MASIHPGAPDVCGDGVNNDCDHVDDDTRGTRFGDYTINSPSDLALLSGYSSITGELRISLSDAFPDHTNVTGLECLVDVDGCLHIHDNAALTNLDGLRGLTSVAGNLTIRGNHVLANLDGLNGLESVGGNLNISNNSALPPCAAEALVARLRAHGWDGTAEIIDNDETGTCP